ncbi:MAG TPA: pilus assembly protein PilM, partial [bacterium]|nr:pilus assembly protein PilM [bacterium]
MAKFKLLSRGPQAKLGLDIGSRFIKLAQSGTSSQGLQLVNVGYAATPLGSVTDGVINNAEAIGEALTQIVKHFHFKEKEVVCSLPGRAVVIRQVSVP